MFITRMAINGSRRGARFLLGSPQAMHAAVLSGFPPGSALQSDVGRTLWRVDHRLDHAIWLCVVSPSRPDLTNIVEQAGWPTQSAWETREYTPLLSRLAEGQRWLFRLTANPVHTAALEDGSVKRLGHVTVAQQQGWLVERAERFGFSVTQDAEGSPDMLVTRRERREFRRGNGRVTLSTAQFDGQLEVTDADALRGALTNGIGRAKGYGCGLMTLVPLPLQSGAARG